MTIDTDDIKRRSEGMTAEEFQAVRRRDLTSAARECYDNELANRDPERLENVRQQDTRAKQRAARTAELKAQDPEPKPRWYMRVVLTIAYLTTAIVVADVWVQLSHDRPVEMRTWLSIGGIWMASWKAYWPYWRARVEWKDRWRKSGLK